MFIMKHVIGNRPLMWRAAAECNRDLACGSWFRLSLRRSSVHPRELPGTVGLASSIKLVLLRSRERRRVAGLSCLE